MHFSRHWLRCVLMLALLALPVAHAQTSLRGQQVQQVLALDSALSEMDDAQPTYPLALLYSHMVQDAADFPREQTSREFLRKFNTPAPAFGNGITSSGDLAPASSANQALLRRVEEEAERAMFGRNMRFIDTYLVGKYLSVFMNGDTQDSAFDLFVDVNNVQQALTGDPESGYQFLPPRFSQNLTNVARYLQGTTAQAVQIDPNIRKQKVDTLASSGKIQFAETGIPVCAVPGVVQNGPAEGLDDNTKRAVLGSLVDFDAAVATANASSDNTQLLNKQQDPSFFEQFLAGKNVNLPNWSACPLDIFCARLDFIKSVPQPAPGLLQRPLPLMTSIQSITDVSRALSNTPLETKYQARSMLSYSFANLNLLGQTYKPSLSLEVRWVPIFQYYDANKAFNMDAVDDLIKNYTAIVYGDLRRTITSAVNPDQAPATQVLNDSAVVDKTLENISAYKSTMLLRSMIFWNASYLKVMGDRLVQLQAQATQLQVALGDLATAMSNLKDVPSLHSK